MIIINELDKQFFFVRDADLEQLISRTMLETNNADNAQGNIEISQGEKLSMDLFYNVNYKGFEPLTSIEKARILMSQEEEREHELKRTLFAPFDLETGTTDEAAAA